MVPSGIIHQCKWKCVYLLKKQNKIQKRKKKKSSNLRILLSMAHYCQEYWHLIPHPVYVMLGIKPGLCVHKQTLVIQLYFQPQPVSFRTNSSLKAMSCLFYLWLLFYIYVYESFACCPWLSEEGLTPWNWSSM